MAIHEIFPSLCVRDANKASLFYQEVFGGKEKFRLVEPSGRIGHLELDLGIGTIMISEEFPECDITAPDDGQKTSSFSIHLHVDNADKVIERAVAAGARVIRPAQDQFYGERSGTFRDPFGHQWNVGHALEQVSTEEMQRRYTALLTTQT